MSVNNKIEAAKFEPETEIEKKIDDIKADHMKNIYSLDMKILDIGSTKTSSSSELLTTNSNIWTT